MRSLASLLPSFARGRHGLPSVAGKLSRAAFPVRIPATLHCFALLPAFALLLLSGCDSDRSTVLAPSSAEASLQTPAEPSPAPPAPEPAANVVLQAVEAQTSTAEPTAEAEPSEPEQIPLPEECRRFKKGECPEYARQCGWPVDMPEPLPGAILPEKRLVAYYGNPNSKRMGVLGEYAKEEMLDRLLAQAKEWEEADPAVPVQPALHLVAVVAQGEPGKAGKYRMIMPDEVVNRVYRWAQEIGAVLFIDIQTGQDDLRTLLPRFEWILQNPDVHLGVDPEFNMAPSGRIPGAKIGTIDAAEINFAADYLAGLVRRHNLPPKVFVVHRFTQGMVTNAREIKLRPEVQVVMHMDGWGASWLKRTTYMDYIVSEPVQYAGFKLFYHNDTKKGDPLMTPEDVLRLQPQPFYIQYQ